MNEAPISQKSSSDEKCVLLFSGGRDSTLAAVELGKRYELTLLTIRGGHLHGFDAVVRRAVELSRLVPASTRWYVAERRQPKSGAEALRGCMGCQLTAVVAAVELARQIGAQTVATGYAGYQSSWIEQSIGSRVILETALTGNGVRLELPALAINTKDQAVAALAAHSLTTEALEQKCGLQQRNPVLSADERRDALLAWESHLHAYLARSHDFRFIGPARLDELGHANG